VSLPAADDLFRPTASPAKDPEPAREPAPEPSAPDATSGAGPDAEPAPESPRVRKASGESGASRRTGSKGRSPSGRVRHDEKMTVYVTADELLDLEHARLLLRRDHGLAVDRGRIVREAVALALADLDARGEDSVIVQRLKQR
jgi:hypothetical protein